MKRGQMPQDRTAAIYCRISRDALGDGEGVERQERLCRELAERLNLSVVQVYSDNDIGASDQTSKKKVRVRYQQMLQDGREGRFTHILAYSNSRLTRRLLELQDLADLNKDTGIVIHTVVAGAVDLSSSDNLMTAQLIAVVDAAESRRIAERQKAAFRERAMKGEPKLQRQRAFGWQKDGVTIEPEEAALIRQAVQELIDGASITAIAKKWEQAGVLTAAGGATWEWSVMQRVLVGWRTAGVRTYRRKPLEDGKGGFVKGTWEPIISLEEREAAIAMLQNRSLKKERQGHWLLSGLVKCGVCGKNAYGQLKPNPNHDTYGCKNGHVAINARRLETYVVSSVWARVFNREVAGTTESAAPYEPEPFPKDERIATVEGKIAEVMEAYEADILDGAIALPQAQRLQNELSDLRKEKERFMAERATPSRTVVLDGTVGDFTQGVKAVAEMVEGGTLGERQAVLRRELEAVGVKKGVQGRNSQSGKAEDWMPMIEERTDLVWRRFTGAHDRRPLSSWMDVSEPIS